MSTQVIDPCNDCGESTAWGSGNFVNRMSADDGWLCAGCMSRDCDRCEDSIPLDEDYYAPNGDNVHYDCMNAEEKIIWEMEWEAS